MNNLSARQQIAAVGIGALLIIIVFFLLGWRPQLARLGKLRDERVQVQKELQKDKNTLIQYKTLEKSSDKLDTQLAKAEKQLPDEANLQPLVKDLQDVANEAGLDFANIEVGEAVDQNGYRSVNLKIDVTGTYFDVVDYLYRLANLSREFKVVDITMENDGWPTLAVSVNSEVYIYAPDAEAQGEGAKAAKGASSGSGQASGSAAAGKSTAG